MEIRRTTVKILVGKLLQVYNQSPKHPQFVCAYVIYVKIYFPDCPRSGTALGASAPDTLVRLNHPPQIASPSLQYPSRPFAPYLHFTGAFPSAHTPTHRHHSLTAVTLCKGYVLVCWPV